MFSTLFCFMKETRMKRLLTALLSLLIIVSCLATATSCKKNKSSKKSGSSDSDQSTADHTHSFDQMIEDSDYLKKAETVINRRTYYYSCECGEHGDETFTVGDALPVYFGSYPQTLVEEKNLNLGLTSLAGGMPSASNSRNWTSYSYYINGVSADLMWYIDIDYNGDRYRGVYFESYRPAQTVDTSDILNSYQSANGYDIMQVYWFKYEPIEWHAVESSDGQILLLADMILDAQQYSYDPYGTSSGYLNVYGSSSLRDWLNDDFYRTAFSDFEHQSMITTEISYTVSVPGSAAAELTVDDDVFLLSSDELSDSEFYGGVSSRVKRTTDYALCQGAFSEDGNGVWWLRTDGGTFSYTGSTSDAVGTNGSAKSGGIKDTSYGVVPAIWVHMDEDGYAFHHSFDVMDSNDVYHWNECICGEEKGDYAEHEYGSWKQTEAPPVIKRE